MLRKKERYIHIKITIRFCYIFLLDLHKEQTSVGFVNSRLYIVHDKSRFQNVRTYISEKNVIVTEYVWLVYEISKEWCDDEWDENNFHINQKMGTKMPEAERSNTVCAFLCVCFWVLSWKNHCKATFIGLVVTWVTYVSPFCHFFV